MAGTRSYFCCVYIIERSPAAGSVWSCGSYALGLVRGQAGSSTGQLRDVLGVGLCAIVFIYLDRFRAALFHTRVYAGTIEGAARAPSGARTHRERMV